jgi:hypothetical protein
MYGMKDRPLSKYHNIMQHCEVLKQCLKGQLDKIFLSASSHPRMPK